ncbi:cystathionine gamma-lyase [Parasteatoda tepidariorum]|uniref:cystathionine gamma-lyase n=1 Tax=Parasteatoda tepidariorum TaxID=114398 RepID=UPI00077FAE11|nr:cystathionine gamma-lyase [Parasteatoda tepidariorum]
MSPPSADFATRCIHDGQDPEKWKSRAVIPPISLSTTFKQFSPGETAGFDYSRSGNPTRECLQQSIASLENGKYALCFASGLAATMSLTYLLKAGDHIICFDDLYGGTNRFFRTCASKMGLETSFVDMVELKNIANAIQPNTKMIWIETPTNPTMKMVDIAGVAKLIENHPQIISVVDNTFMSSYFQKPLTLGAHIVHHSLTKYMNGHSDVVMGAIATNNQDLYEKMKYYQNSLGTVPSPFDCFLVNRGLKTLHIRMERHMENAQKVAEFLETHKYVEKVIYPGLKSYPQYELAHKQCSGTSGMVSFYVKGGLTEAQKFIGNLQIFTLAESLGGIESLAEIPSVMTHASVPEDQRAKLGISDNLVRLSVGIESIKDLIADLDQALQISQK